MSLDTHHELISYYFAAGVFKLDSMSAGFPDLQKIATKWSKDQNFKHLIVRKVSKSNYGIQFFYVQKKAEDSVTIKTYRDELKKKYADGFYAWDYQEGSWEDSEDGKAKLEQMIICHRDLNL